MGAPDPFELAKKTKLEQEKLENETKEIKLQQKGDLNQAKNEIETKTKDDFINNWDDQGDWFSPINKLTTTVHFPIPHSLVIYLMGL